MPASCGPRTARAARQAARSSERVSHGRPRARPITARGHAPFVRTATRDRRRAMGVRHPASACGHAGVRWTAAAAPAHRRDAREVLGRRRGRSVRPAEPLGCRALARRRVPRRAGGGHGLGAGPRVRRRRDAAWGARARPCRAPSRSRPGSGRAVPRSGGARRGGGPTARRPRRQGARSSTWQFDVAVRPGDDDRPRLPVPPQGRAREARNSPKGTELTDASGRKRPVPGGREGRRRRGHVHRDDGRARRLRAGCRPRRPRFLGVAGLGAFLPEAGFGIGARYGDVRRGPLTSASREILTVARHP
jgi:hypothetical protein